MEPENNPNLHRHYRTVVLMGGAAAAGMLLMALLVALLPEREGWLPDGNLGFLRGIAVIVAVVLYFVLRSVRNRMLLTERLASMVDQALIPRQRYRRMLHSVAITFAYSEALALFGFVFFLLTGRAWDFYLFLALAVLSLALYFPGHRRWQQWYAHRNLVR